MLENIGVEATNLAFSLSSLLDDLVKPYCVGLADWQTLAMCKLAPLFLEESCPARGWQCC